ncbi:acyltransferase [Nonomuraea dietziae]|uniref:acyltransferase family protein n=1 Tax=Nonomuraea dietziae TaxID=65515 RepID=UPI0031CFEBDB
MRRERRIDVLLATSVTVGILGQWLATSYVVTDDLHVASLLTAVPELAPATWLLQTLPVFFFTSGYAHGGEGSSAALRLRPMLTFLLAWGAGLAVLSVNGFSLAAIREILGPVLQPLWFLVPYLLLTAVAPWLRRAVLRYGWGTALVPGISVALVDLARFAWPELGWLGSVNAISAWAVPFLLGLAWRQGSISGAWLLSGGGMLAAMLIALGHYPVDMVDVPGAPVSNIAPPTAALLAFGCAQCGLAALAGDRLGPLGRRPPDRGPDQRRGLPALPLASNGACYHLAGHGPVRSGRRAHQPADQHDLADAAVRLDAPLRDDADRIAGAGTAACAEAPCGSQQPVRRGPRISALTPPPARTQACRGCVPPRCA